jgi:hypothetical protein
MNFDIGSISSFRLTAGNNEGKVVYGYTEVKPYELFMIPQGGLPSLISGAFRPNPITGSVFELKNYRIGHMRTSMVGLVIPLRWYFGEQRTGRPRFHLEAGYGLDLVLVQADYVVTTHSVTFDASLYNFVFDAGTVSGSEPMNGAVSNNLLFSNGSIGGGVTVGRFMLFTQMRFLFTSTYIRGDKEYKRVHGNILAMPALTGADDDPEIAARVAQDGAVIFGRTEMSNAKDEEVGPTGNGDIEGVTDIWNPRQLILGVAFRLR